MKTINVSKSTSWLHKARNAGRSLALISLLAPASLFAIGPTINKVTPANGAVTVEWSGGTAPYQLEKSRDLQNWEQVDLQTFSTSLSSIQTSPNAFYRLKSGTQGNGTDRKAPTVPTGLTARASSCSQVNLSWTASTDSNSGVGQYNVYRDGLFLVTIPAPTTSATDTNVTGSSTYSYAVLAVDKAGNASAKCTAVSVTTPYCGDTTPPAVPSGLTASAVSCSQVNVGWSASTDNNGGSGVQGYTVYRNGAFFKSVAAPATSVSDTGLAAGAVCSYTVSAIDNAGNQSAQSAATSATTPACADTTPPTVPAGVTATAVSSSQINIAWSASTDTGTGVKEYDVYRNGVYVSTTPTTSYSATSLAAGSTYCFNVLARDNSLNVSAQSASACATTVATCSYALSPTSASPSASGGGWGVTVTAGAGCAWSATSSATSWLTIAAGASGTGNGTVSYTVAANTSTTSRSASLTIGGQVFNVTQAGAAPTCTYTLSAPSVSLTASASSGSVGVTAGAGCAWTASSSATTWLTITAGASGSGNGTVSYSATANTSTSSRTASLTIGGQVFNVTQAGATPTCTYTLSAPSVSLTASASSGSVGVTAGAGCAWTASSSATTWLTITAGASGSGNGTVSYSATANTSTTSRSASLTIGGQVFNVTQAGAAPTCTYTLSAPSVSLPASAATGSVGVTAGTGCAWTAGSSATTWLTITAGASGSGNGTVSYSATANTSTTSRSASLTIGGQVFNVTQAGATPTCTYTLSAPSASAGAVGSSGTVTVNAGSGCTWTPSSSAAWLTFSPASGSGTANVTWAAAANTGCSSRSATLTIAGQVFTVNQAAGSGSFSISPTSVSAVPATGASGSVTVTATAGCAWLASSSASWLTFTPTTGSGNGSVSWTAAANTLTSTRSATLTIAGQTFSVSQAAAVVIDTTPPSVSLMSPTGGTTVSNMMTLTASASDSGSGISRVEFYCDSTVLLGTASASPYSISADTKNMPNGNHVLYSKAYDGAGNSSSSANVSVMVNNTVVSSGPWLKQFGGTGYDYGKALAVDASGNVFMAGYSDGALDLGGGILLGAGSWDLILAKYSPAGVQLWSKRYGGSGTEGVNAIALDAAGNIFVAGSFYGSANFGGATFTSAGDADMFVAKYDANGNHVWSQAFGDTLTDFINDVAVDSAGNVILTGSYSGIVPLISPTGTSFTTTGFLLKLSSDGTKVWTKNFNSCPNVGTSLAVDRSDNILLLGYFQGGINLGTGTLVTSQSGGYLGKFSPAGDCLWARNVGLSAFPYYTRSGALAVDSNGDVAVSGYYANSSDLGYNTLASPASVSRTIQGTSSGWDMFVAKYAGASGAFQWATPINGDHNGEIRSIATDPQNNILLGGYFLGTYNFGSVSLTSPTYGVKNGFVAKYNSSGNVVWARGLIGTAAQEIGAVASDSSGNPIITGTFSGSATFSSQTLNSVSASSDLLIGKIAP